MKKRVKIMKRYYHMILFITLKCLWINTEMTKKLSNTTDYEFRQQDLLYDLKMWDCGTNMYTVHTTYLIYNQFIFSITWYVLNWLRKTLNNQYALKAKLNLTSAHEEKNSRAEYHIQYSSRTWCWQKKILNRIGHNIESF